MDRLDAAIAAFREVEPHAIINRAALYAAINAERERCASVAESWPRDGAAGSEWDACAAGIAAAIRNPS